MRQNTPSRAYDRYARSLQSVVGCITERRLTLSERRNIEIDRAYAIVLNGGDGAFLSSRYGDLQLDLGQRFRIVRDLEAADGPFRATTVEYWYRFTLVDGPALISYHWTPETTDTAQRTFPHLHVEAGLIRSAAPPLRSFNKLHVPTGHVSTESIIRFAIEELEVPPIRSAWRSLLERSDGL